MKSLKVLIVDDDPATLDLMERLFLRNGVESLTAETPEAAVAALAEHRLEVGLILADWRFSEDVDASQLYRVLETDYPEMTEHFVVFSGYPDDPDLRTFVSRTGCRMASKPYKVGQAKALLCRLKCG